MTGSLVGDGPLSLSLLPFSLFFALDCVSLLLLFMGCKSDLFFYGCLKLRFPDVAVNPGPRVAPQYQYQWSAWQQK